MTILCEHGEVTDAAKKTAGIYYWKNNVNGKGYVGQTLNLRTRTQSYRNQPNPRQRLLYFAIQKYGFENFTCYKVMDCCPSKVALNYWEKYWVKTLDTFGPNGYNLSIGGGARDELSIARQKATIRFNNREKWRKKNRPLSFAAMHSCGVE